MIAETMNSDSDLLDDIFEPATAIEKASRFQPKPRITKNKIIPKSSKSAVSEGPSSNPKFPDAAESKRPVEGSSGSSGGHLDVHNPEENFEFSISNNVLDKVSQFGIGEPEQRSDVSCSLESLDGHNKNFPASETRNSDSDLLDDIFAPATTIEKASRFQPKPRITKKKIIPKSSKSAVSEGPSSNPKFPDAAESKKPVEGSSGSSSGHLDVHNPEEEIEFSISNIVLDKDPQFGVGEREPEQCTVVSCSLESLDGYKKDFSVSGADGPIFTSNLDSVISEPISVSSELEMSQTSLVTEGFSANVETSDLSLRHANLRTYSVEVENEPTTLDSSVDPLDDLFSQSDQPAAKQNGKFRPKLSSRLKEGKKMKSSFVPPDNGVKSAAPVEYQLELVTSNSLEGINSSIEMTCDQNVDKSLGSLSASNRDNQVDLVNVVRKDEVEISALGTHAILSKASRNSGADSVSSEHEVSQSSLVINGYAANIEASDLSSRHTEVGNEPTTADSSAELLDDLFLQSDQSAGKKVVKCRPKPCLRVKKGKKVKSVTFMLPDNGVEPLAFAECQSKPVTLSPPKEITSFVGMLTDQNMDETLGSLSTSSRDNQVDLDGIDLSAIGSLNIVSDPNYNSGSCALDSDIGSVATCRVPITLSVQSFVEHEDIRNMEGEDTTYNIEPNLEECAPNNVQNDETLNSSRRVRQRNRKLKSCAVENMASRDQNAKDAISQVHEDYDGVHYMDEDMPKEKKTKATRNSCSRSSENESSLKSSKKASEKLDSANKDPPKKKLPHGSRSKNTKRQVNKAYLEIPDDEADRRKLAIRDLIRLAGFKERIASKEAASLKNSFANQSGDQEEDPDADDEDREIKGDVPKLNYHSYMKRPQQIRWSNTETEFFYQAIRQFGTDFAMIQVLFPNRSREQVKAKFKNEQRKRPLQIADAIFRRSKDHSHFEKVIQHLKTAAEQSAKNDPSTVSKDEADENEDQRSATNTKDEQEVNYF